MLGWHFFYCLYLVGNLPPGHQNTACTEEERKDSVPKPPAATEREAIKVTMSPVLCRDPHQGPAKQQRVTSGLHLRSTHDSSGEATQCTLQYLGIFPQEKEVPTLLPSALKSDLALSPQTRAQLLSATAVCHLRSLILLETLNFHLAISRKTILGSLRSDQN